MKKILLSFILPCPVFGQWTNNTSLNTVLCNATGNQEEVRVISDAAGGAIVTWMDSRPAGNSDIYAQRIDSSGYPLWTANGVPICTEVSNQTVPAIVEDGNGGAFIVWKDSRNGNSDIYAQRISSTGSVLWAADGIAVDTKSGEQIEPKIVSDGSNGAIITWQDSVSGNWDIYAQRINSSGNKIWSAGGVAVCTAADDQKNPRIEAAISGEVIIVWQDKRNGNDYNIYGQKLNSIGSMLWAVNGVAICSAADTQNNPKIESDGTEGVIIGWVDKRNGNDYNIYAQRLDSSGVPKWASNGVPITVETGNQSAIDISSKNISGAVFSWKDYRNNIYADIYAQYIDSSGVVKWAVNGIPISTKLFDQINPNIVTDSTGAIIVWQDSSSGQWDAYAQKVLLNGAIQWGANGKVIGNAINNQTGTKHIIDGKGGAIVAWQDDRDTSKNDIYAQNINANGTLGNIVGINEFRFSDKGIKVFPNPNDGKFVLQNSSPASSGVFGKIEIFNVFGEQVFHSEFSGIRTVFDLSNQPKGIYFFRISPEKEPVQSGKIIIR